MVDKRILKEQVFQVPLIYNSEKGFKEATLAYLSEYISILKKYNCKDEIIDKVIHFRFYYKEMLELYYVGQHSRAFKKFSTSINHLDRKNVLYLTPITEKDFYRARINNTSTQYSLDEMSHISFDKRNIVKTERYSFPGLPCLYFGASVYACWVEMGCPPYDVFQVARAQYNAEDNDQERILDISLLPWLVEEKINAGEKIDLDMYLLLWPVIAMCMIQVNDKDAAFKPEYIFPQFLMEYVSSNEAGNVIGIKYASTRVSSYEQFEGDGRIYSCYVFPTASKTDKKCEDGKLAGCFTFKNTISGINQNILSYNRGIMSLKEYMVFSKKKNELIRINDEYKISYDSTRFCEIEFALSENWSEI